MKSEKILVIFISLAVLFITTSVSAQTTASDPCKISLSLNVTPDFLIIPPDSVVDSPDFLVPPSSVVPKTNISGDFNATEKCKAPFTIHLFDEVRSEPPVIIDTTTKNLSYSFKKDVNNNRTMTGDRRVKLSVADACGYNNNVSVYNSVVDGGNTSKAAFDLLKKKHPPESSKKSDGSKTQYNPNNPRPAQELKVSDIVSTSVDFDPEYVKETIRDRHFTPHKPFAPLDIVQVKIEVKIPSCLSRDIINDLKNTYFTGTLVGIDFKGDESNINSGKFSLVEPYTGGNATFSMKLLLSASEDLISAIKEAKPIEIKINDDSQSISQSVPIQKPTKKVVFEMTNCAQVYGSGFLKVVNMRGRSSQMTPADLVTIADKNIKEGFDAIEPFKVSRQRFSHFVDFEIEPDSVWPMRNIGNSSAFAESYYDRVPNYSSCNSSSRLFILYSDRISSSYTAKFAKVIFMEKPDTSYSPRALIHEVGHALAGLQDEYVYKGSYGRNSADDGLFTGKNCAKLPAVDFSYNGNRYGDINRQGCGKSSLYRSTDDSMMKNTKNNFNVVSCGYIFAAIEGGNGPEYWQKCMEINTIVKPYGMPNYHGMLPFQKNITDSLDGLLMAQVVKAPIVENIIDKIPEKSTESGKYYILENFSPGGTITGDIFPIIDDENGEISPTPVPEPAPTFDLSIRPVTKPPSPYTSGKDESIAVLKGSNIELKWTSDGSSKCSLIEAEAQIPLSTDPESNNFVQKNLIFPTYQYQLTCGASVETVNVMVYKEGEKPPTFISKVSSLVETAVKKVSCSVLNNCPPPPLPPPPVPVLPKLTTPQITASPSPKVVPTAIPSSTPSPSVTASPTLTPSITPSPSSSLPNLQPSTPTIAGTPTGTQSQFYTGSITIKSTITNTGTGSGGSSSTYFQFSTDGTNFFDWAPISLPTLSVGASYTASYTWNGGTGTYYFRTRINSTYSSPVTFAIVSLPAQSPSPSPSVTPSSTPSPSATPISSVTASPSPTSSPSPSPTVSPSSTPLQTVSVTPTPTTSATPTPTTSSSPSPSSSPSVTASPSPTTTASPSSSHSSSSTSSPSPSSSLSPSSSASPSSSSHASADRSNRSVLAAALYALGDFLDSLFSLQK